MEHDEGKTGEVTAEHMMDIQAQLSQVQKSLKTVEENLNKPAAHQHGFWIERLMYWLIVIGLIVAVIMVG